MQLFEIDVRCFRCLMLTNPLRLFSVVNFILIGGLLDL